MPETPIPPFDWKACCPTPWEGGNICFFALPDERLYQASELKLTWEAANGLAEFLACFTHVTCFAGLRESMGRVAEWIKQDGENDEAIAWMKAAVCVQIVQQSLIDLAREYQAYLGEAARSPQQMNEVSYPFSPTHLWAIHEGASYLQLDTLPMLEKEGTTPVPDPEGLMQNVQAVQDLTQQAYALLDGEAHPYRCLLDTASIEMEE